MDLVCDRYGKPHLSCHEIAAVDVIASSPAAGCETWEKIIQKKVFLQMVLGRLIFARQSTAVYL